MNKNTYQSATFALALVVSAFITLPASAQNIPDVLGEFNSSEHGIDRYQNRVANSGELLTSRVAANGTAFNATIAVNTAMTAANAAATAYNTAVASRANAVTNYNTALAAVNNSLPVAANRNATHNNFVAAYSAYLTAAANNGLNDALYANVYTTAVAVGSGDLGGANNDLRVGNSDVAANNTANVAAQTAVNTAATALATAQNAETAVATQAAGVDATINAFRSLALYQGYVNATDGVNLPGMGTVSTALDSQVAHARITYLSAYSTTETAATNAHSDAVRGVVTSAAVDSNAAVATAYSAFETQLHAVSRARFADNATDNTAFLTSLNAIVTAANVAFDGRTNLTAAETALNAAATAYAANTTDAALQAAFSSASKAVAGSSNSGLASAVNTLYDIELAAVGTSLSQDTEFTTAETAAADALFALTEALSLNGNAASRTNYATFATNAQGVFNALLSGSNSSIHADLRGTIGDTLLTEATNLFTASTTALTAYESAWEGNSAGTVPGSVRVIEAQVAAVVREHDATVAAREAAVTTAQGGVTTAQAALQALRDDDTADDDQATEITAAMAAVTAAEAVVTSAQAAVVAANTARTNYIAASGVIVAAESNSANRPHLAWLSRGLRNADVNGDGTVDYDTSIEILNITRDLHSRSTAANTTITALTARTQALATRIAANATLIAQNTASIDDQSRAIEALHERARSAADGVAAAYALAGVPQLPGKLNITVSAGDFDGQQALGVSVHGQVSEKIAFSGAFVRSGDNTGLATGLTIGL